MRFAHTVTVLALPIAILASSSGADQAASTRGPRFERTPCAAEVVAEERIECGTLAVPENRRKADSRTIHLPVMIFKSRAAVAAPDPIVFITGGPGNSNVAGRRSGKGIPFLDERDYILLEPRGAGSPSPRSSARPPAALKGEIAAGRLRGEAAQAKLVEAARACRATLVASGVDLDGYTSEAAADDIEDLRRALGIEQWNLQGVSYGTRLALTVLRKHPGGVRSVILDSVLPPDVNFDEVSAVNLQRSLNLVFDGCAIDRDCGAAFPDLRRRFADLVAAADRRPLPLSIAPADAGGKPAEIRGEQVVDAIYSALHNPQAIPYIPRIIANAAAGRFDELTELVKGNQGPSRFAWGMRYSVWCAEESPFEDPRRVASQTSPALGLGGIDEGTATAAACRAWNVSPAPAVENEPVSSQVPALIFAGEFDPDTPPDWGRQLLETMPKAFYLDFRGRSHGAGFGACGAQIAAAFLRSPDGPLPVNCALTLRGADFGLSARPKR